MILLRLAWLLGVVAQIFLFFLFYSSHYFSHMGFHLDKKFICLLSHLWFLNGLSSLHWSRCTWPRLSSISKCVIFGCHVIAIWLGHKIQPTVMITLRVHYGDMLCSFSAPVCNCFWQIRGVHGGPMGWAKDRGLLRLFGCLILKSVYVVFAGSRGCYMECELWSMTMRAVKYESYLWASTILVHAPSSGPL